MDTFSIISLFIAFIIGITIHESAHAWMGNKLGDSTAKDLGRISLNPLRHIDPIGTLLLPLIGLISPSHSFFGWAKPTPYNPHNLKDGKKDAMIISLAGPLSNLLLAIVCIGIFYLYPFASGFFRTPLNDNILTFIYICIFENITLAFFNLIPVPPLDGSSLLKLILPESFNAQLNFFNRFGFLLLVVSSRGPLGNLVSQYLDFCTSTFLRFFGISY